MKKAIFLLSALALMGCEEDDVKAAVDGNARVFAVSGVQVKEGGWGAVPAGYHTRESVTETYGNIIPDGIPTGDGSALTSAGIKFDEKTSCGKIDITDKVCFKDNGNSGCVPEEIEMLGLKVFTIDKDDVEKAADHGFYPTVAADLGSLYIDIDYQDVECSLLK